MFLTSSFLQIPSRNVHPCLRLYLSHYGRIRDFYPLETCAVRRTSKKDAGFLPRPHYYLALSSLTFDTSFPISTFISAAPERVEAEIVYAPVVAETHEYQYNADAFEARGAADMKVEIGKEVSKVREDKAR
jgi:hypothetical protein